MASVGGKLSMSMENWWNEPDRKKIEALGGSHTDRHISHTLWPSPRWEAGKYRQWEQRNESDDKRSTTAP